MRVGLFIAKQKSRRQLFGTETRGACAARGIAANKIPKFDEELRGIATILPRTRGQTLFHLLSSGLYRRLWIFTKSCLVRVRGLGSRAFVERLPPIGNFTLPRRLCIHLILVYRESGALSKFC
jgi:hypothetical protein